MNDQERLVLEAAMQIIGEKAGRVRDKHDLPAGFSATTNLIGGPDGVFGQVGAEPDVISTRITPRGLNAVLPVFPTNVEDPILPYLTGITDEESGSEPTNSCDDPLAAGEYKSGYMGAFFGKIQRKTQTLDLSELGKMNRGETSLRMVNDFLGQGDFSTPTGAFDYRGIFAREVQARLNLVGVAFQNKIGALNWAGDTANNTSGGYAEFVGLETLVSTGKLDILSGASLPSMDSDVKDFNYSTVEANSDDLFAVLTMMYRYVKHNAIRGNFGGVQWAFAMRQELFNELVDRWPLVYASYRGNSATPTATQRNMTDAMVMRQMADQLRNGEYLTIDGVDIPVILDDYIPEATSTTDANVVEGNYASDIYLLPLTVMNGQMPVLYHEYFNYDGQNAARQAITDGNLAGQAWTTDNGKFLWTHSQTNHCFEWHGLVKPRLILRTPHLAARLQNVMYAPLQHLRHPDPSDAYFTNGGRTSADFAPYDTTYVS